MRSTAPERLSMRQVYTAQENPLTKSGVSVKRQPIIHKYNRTMLRNHPLFQTLRELKGNPRITVLTEVMFGIPYNMFAPFVSVYMLALGLNDQQIGSIASLGLLVQVFTALLSGAIVDKFGCRLTLLIFDVLCWSVPCLIWAAARDFCYFFVPALLNSF